MARVMPCSLLARFAKMRMTTETPIHLCSLATSSSGRVHILRQPWKAVYADHQGVYAFPPPHHFRWMVTCPRQKEEPDR